MNHRAATLAIGLHAALLLTLLPSCAKPPPPATPPPATKPDAEMVFVGIVPDGTLACERAYVGIGVMASAMGRIYDVAPGSPAERAMIREGDYFENADDFAPDMLPIGTEITLLIRRSEVTTAKKVRVARVCYR